MKKLHRHRQTVKLTELHRDAWRQLLAAIVRGKVRRILLNDAVDNLLDRPERRQIWKSPWRDEIAALTAKFPGVEIRSTRLGWFVTYRAPKPQPQPMEGTNP